MKLYILAMSAVVFFLGSGVFLVSEIYKRNNEVVVITPPPISTPTPQPTPTPTPSPTPLPQSILYDVPFTSQAPSGQWNNEIYQNGCEEASMLMAMKWVRGEELTKDEAEREIAAISNYEIELYGHAVDQSAIDTATVMRGYFGYDQIEVVDQASSEKIIIELMKGHIVIAPMNGRLLGNPNFTAPGPLQHMVVVVGYDLSTNEFITNDPGTRNGKQYRYNTQVFDVAMRDYPTGKHEPIIITLKKIIVIQPMKV
jgi:hypothetical protein